MACDLSPVCKLCVYSYSVEYVEDTDPVLLLNTSDFTISDEDNVFLLQGKLTVDTTGMLSKCMELHFCHTYIDQFTMNL